MNYVSKRMWIEREFQTAAAGVASVIMNALLEFQSALVSWIEHPKMAAQVPTPSGVLRVFEPDSPQARAIFNLGVTASIILALIFSIVFGVIVYALMRFRWREGEADPRQFTGNKKAELKWSAISFVIVVFLFVLTAHTMSVSDPPPAPEPDLVVIGHQWWWEARYPKSGVVVANEIHIPMGKALSIRLDSTDVLHEFWVPELARKMTTVPGHPNSIWIEADQPKTYRGVCSEFCGTEHAWMRFLVIAEPPETFDAWEKTQLQPAPKPTNEVAARGLDLFLRSSCVNCHAINGTTAKAQFAPDLTHFASRRDLGAEIAPNTDKNLCLWLANPDQVKPGVKMPNFKFTDEQVKELAAYLETLK